MANLSRRQLARTLAAKLSAGAEQKELMKQLAAYLIDHRQTKNATLYIADIEAELAANGSVVADVTTARALDNAGRMRVEAYVQKSTSASAVTLREHVDPNIIGGIIIRVSGHELDASVSSQLRQLKVA